MLKITIMILENNEGLEELNKKCEIFAKEIDNWK